jgi:hypothetical protein
MTITRKTFLRRAMTGSLLAAAGMPSWAQQVAGGPRPKVLVVFTPDRPINWFQDALPMRFVGLPWQEKSERFPLLGIDFQSLLLPSFSKAASQEWPHVDFVPVPEFAIAVSNQAGPSFHEATFPVLPSHIPNIQELLNQSEVTAVINLASPGAGNQSRPYGGVKLWMLGIEGSLTKNVDELRYRASISWVFSAHIRERARGGLWGRGGVKSTSVGDVGYSARIPDGEGTRAHLLEAFTRRSSELLELISNSMPEMWAGQFGLRQIRDQLAMNKERQPYYYTLPF